MTAETCLCAGLMRRSFEYCEDSPTPVALIDGSDLVARAEFRWSSVYRCRVCAAHWVEATAESGHAVLPHVYPLPQGITDVAAWLEMCGDPLPKRMGQG